ncbi:MAG: Ig-like domain-containing protein, partial [Candidatus Promineifilaceae bacterium]
MQRNLTILALFALILVLIARTCGGPAEPAPAVTPTEVIIEPTETVDTPTEESVRELTPTPAATETTEPATTEPEPTLEPTVEIIPTLTSEPEASLIEEADWEPQVVSSSPALGEEVTLNGAITIRFDQAMDQASVEEAFSIDGDIDGAFVWTRADEVTFTPAGQLERQQEYQVQIAASARSVNGKALREPLSLHFQTIGALEVSQIIPADGTADVSADATITILFNRPVVPLVSTGQQADLVQPLTFLPAIAGEGEWVNTSIYRFTPTDPLLAATTYDVGIVDGLQDVTGNEMVQTFDASFRTVAPQVVLINEGVQDEIAPDQTISVTFNMPMSQPETQAVIEWKPPVAVTYNWSADGRTVGVTPVERMQLDTNYTLFVGEFAMAAKGRAEMGSPTLAQFTTFPFPAVSGTAPNPGEVIDGDGLTYWRGISFNFETPMNRDTVLNDLIIEPAPVDPTYSGADLRYYVDFAFEYETVYRVTVPATAQDIYGNEMGEAYVFEFETGSAPPVGAFNLPPVLTQLSRSFPSNVNFIYRNIESASIRLEQFETLPLDQLTGSFHYYYNGDKNGAVGETVREWSFEYEPATAGATEIALADGSALPNGVYRLVASSPQLTQENSGWQNQDVLLVIGETNLTIKETPETVHVWATDLDSGQPVAGRDLTFFYRSRDVVRSFATAATDENGFASVSKAFSESDSDRYSYDNILVQTGEPGEFGFGLASTGWNTGVRSWDLNVSARSSPERSQSMVLYTDRPLYRPGDTVHVRGWVRDNNFGRYTIPTPDTIELSLRSPDYNNEPLDLTFDLDENGGFYGEWVIPEDAMLGGWVFNVDMERFDGKADRSIVVAEFRKPEYLVEVTPSEPEALRGEDVEMVVSAEYFFGGAAAGLPIEYTIYANPYNEPIERSAYQFSNRAYSPYSYYGGGGYGFGNYVNSGYGETDAAGNYIIKIPNRLLDEQDAGGLRLSVEAKIVDTTGLAVTGNGELLLHPAAVYVGSKPQQYVSDVNSGVVIDVITVDWNGETVAEQSVEVVFAKRDWKAMPHDFDPGRVKWEAVDNEVAQVSLTTDANGQVVASFAPEAGGIYVAISTVTDANGRTHTNNTTIYVWGDETTWRFDQQERQMSLTASEDQLNVGDSAEILVQAPFAGMRAWLMIERGELIEQRLITLDGTSEVLTLDMLPEHAPNVFVSLAAVKGADESERPVADIRYGVVEL